MANKSVRKNQKIDYQGKCENIWGRDNCSTNRKSYGPGQHGPRGIRRLSGYGVQLRENKTQRLLRKYWRKAI